jgi:DNA-binding response OmpR family regulator
MVPKRILLIEDDEDYVQLVTVALAACGDGFEVQSAALLGAGLVLIDQYLPDLILVDLSLPDSSGYQTFQHVRDRAQTTPIVVMTGLDDDHLATRAIEDGAQDYLVKTLIQPKMIARCVNMALSRQKREALTFSVPGTVLSFIGSKGGVGTSTTAVNVAALLAQNGYETIVIELQQGHPGSLSLYSQTDSSHGFNSLLKKPADAITPCDLQACLVEALSRLYLLYPTLSTGTWRAPGADHVHAMIAAARKTCRFVLLDLPSRVDEGIAEALRLSDSVSMIVDRELASIHCGAAFLEQIRLAISRSREVRLVLVNRTNLEPPLQMHEIHRQLKLDPLVIIPEASATLAISHGARIPLALLCPEDAFSLAHLELADRLLQEATSASHRPGLQMSRKFSGLIIPETTYS